MPPKLCPMCQLVVRGRSDKRFCSAACKSDYHHRLRGVTSQATSRIDKALHRNRSILLEILGKQTTQKTVMRAVLEKKKFSFHYITAMTTNSKGKIYFHIYDFRYMTFSDDRVLIVRR